MKHNKYDIWVESNLFLYEIKDRLQISGQIINATVVFGEKSIRPDINWCFKEMLLCKLGLERQITSFSI